jgi:DNA-binding SARP family transcriptional activator/transcriptional regulator with XRE-family HTH domain
MTANDRRGAAARLGGLIAESRRLAGLTQQQLADRAAVSVGAVRDLEQGRTARPRPATGETLARVLGLELAQLADARPGPARPWHQFGPGPINEATRDGLRLGVLGPLAVWRDGIPVGLGAGRQRAVLGLLAVHPGSAVHRESIIDAVWGSRPPASAVPMVQTYASQLRRLLGGDLLVSDGTSYRLAVTVRDLDALEFAMLADWASDAAASPTPSAACGLYERALRLWRGEPLADVGPLRGHPAVTELAQQRAAVILDYAGVADRAGCPERALPQLRALVSRDPLDERVQARLMLTLAGCGQQAAALAVFDRLRQRLDDELGIAPGADVADAHLRILRGQLSSDVRGAASRAGLRWIPRQEHHGHGTTPAGPKDPAGAVFRWTGSTPGWR